MKTIALIPARLESRRFPNKLIKKLGGIPIIVRTYQAALDTKLFDEVYVVSGNNEIIDLIKSVNGLTFKSTQTHQSGTDRIAEAAKKIDHDIVVNLQGDEPFINIDAINNLISSFENNSVVMASLMTNFKTLNEIKNPNHVKVTTDSDNNAIFFSRSPIPKKVKDLSEYKRHIGVYAFRKDTLINFASLQRSKNEISENLEGNRAIDNLIPIKMVKINFHGVSIDTEEDFLDAEKYLLKND
tara:strand:+ start:49 stop:771 length:723 start_codon:yes stop_codon:yes gene_type:complete